MGTELTCFARISLLHDNNILEFLEFRLYYVTIHSYSLGETDSNGNRKGNANIHITIKMDDSSVIEVKYSGKVLFDGMDG